MIIDRSGLSTSTYSPSIPPFCPHPPTSNMKTRSNGFAGGAFCADSAALANKSSASLNETMQYRTIIADRFTYHFVLAVWRIKKAESARSMSFWQSIRSAINPAPLSQAKADQLNAEAKEFFDKLLTTGKLSVPDNIPLVLGADETALLHEPSKLIESRATRVYSGGGVRVMKGVYIGGCQSSSPSSTARNTAQRARMRPSPLCCSWSETSVRSRESRVSET
jgi:hypothetical protein